MDGFKAWTKGSLLCQLSYFNPCGLFSLSFTVETEKKPMGAKMKAFRFLFRNTVAIGCSLALAASLAQAQVYGSSAYGDEGTGSPKDHLFMLINGGFGSFVMILCGLGGLASLLITRQGQAGKNAPIMGIVMLIVAAAIFALRVMIKSGMMGHEYLEW